MKLTFGSLFAGIGGMDLGLERAGMVCKWQVEINEYCRRVLAKHWPDVPRWDDVRTFPPESGEWAVDLVAGGFPCQPVSLAGKQLAQQDERWLWPEFARTLRVLRPRYALLENVPGLLVHGMGDVLGDLAALGFDAEWQVLPAAAVGAPHLRERVFVLAHAHGEGAGADPHGERCQEQHVPALAARAGQHYRLAFDADRDAPGRRILEAEGTA
jgi:DNA (cytosine-5)-methyltransferase 1